MDWILIIFFFGTLAFVLFIWSMTFFGRKQYKLGLLFACLELLAAVPPSLAWMDALWNSGKSDWYLLGLLGYPFPAVCFYAMFIAGAVCLVLNIRGIVRGRRPAGPGRKQRTDGEAPSEG